MNQDSDLDLLVIKHGVERRANARLTGRPPKSPPLDIVVANTADIELNRHDQSCFIRDRLDNGRVLYDELGN